MSHATEDSDAESLPDISHIISAPPDVQGMSKGDIVWAKFKNLYWPALVRSVYTKEKKISVWYTDDPGKTFKLPLKNVCSFHDMEMRTKIEKEVRDAGCFQEHEGLTSHALRYLKRKAAGQVDDPMKFFDQTYPFYLIEQLLQKNPNADVSSIKIPPLYISHEKKSIRKSLNVKEKTSLAVESDVESVNSDCESDVRDLTNDYLSELQKEISSVSNEDENICKLVEFIKSGKADDYLGKILLKRIPSEHRRIYEREIKLKNKSSTVSYTGPIKNDEKLRELIFYLLPLYNKMTSVRTIKGSLRKRGAKVLEYPSFDKKSESAQYVASVWLPEAIIYAMSVIQNVSLSDAKQLFKKSSESERKHIENILAFLGSKAAASDSAISDQKLVCNKQENIRICSPMKKLCVDSS